MNYAGLFKSVIIMGVVASLTSAVDLFRDDFSNCAESSDKWAVYPPFPDSCIATCGGGVYSLQNRQRVNLLLSIAAIPVKPSTFTASVAITRSNDSIRAGFILCLKTSPSLAGYAIQLDHSQSLTVYKYPGTGSPLYSTRSSFIRGGAATNVVMVSKIGNKLYIYCNGQPLDVVTDAASPLADGDFSLIVPNGRTVTFDDVLITNQGTILPGRKCVVDNFNDNTTIFIENTTAGWLDQSNLATANEISNKYLSITTSATSGAYDYHYTDIDLDTFVSKTIVSFRKGSLGTPYGFFIKGAEVPIGGNLYRTPMVPFAINAQKQYSAGDPMTLGPTSPSIKGAPYISGTDTTFKWDTIAVVKKAGSPYKMFVNGSLLDSVPQADVSFAITGVGFFCYEGLTVYVDSFYVKNDTGACLSIANSAKRQRVIQGAMFNPHENACLFNPLGRKVYALEYYSSNPRNNSSRAPGYYISSNGRSGVVIKKR